MKHIKTLTLQNFQSHKETELELHPGLNVIVGSSDSGKTAIVRALRWAIWNEPRGDSFMRIGAKGETSVSILLSDNSQTKRERGKSKNRYLVWEQEMLGAQTFEGFGVEVPLEVIRAHGMTKADIADKKVPVNVAMQLEPAFLLHEPASTRAKALGRLAGVELIDQAGRTLSGDIYKERQKAKKYEEHLAALQGQIDSYNYLDELKETISKLRAIETQAQAIREKVVTLTRLHNEWQSACEAVEKARHQVDALQWINAVEQIVNRCPVDRLTRLRALHSEFETVTEACRKAEETLQKTTFIPQVEHILSDCNKVVERHNKLITLLQRYNTAVNTVKQAERSLQVAIDDEHTAQREYELLLDEVGVCPLCGGVLSPSHTEGVL